MIDENGNDEARVTIYETPQGFIVRHDNGDEDSIRIMRSRTPGLVFMHLQTNKKDGRRFYQTIEVDPYSARVLAAKISDVAGAVEGAGDE